MESNKTKHTPKINKEGSADVNLKAALPFLMISTLFAGVALGIVITIIPSLFTRDDNQVNVQDVQTVNQTPAPSALRNLETDQLNQVYEYLNTTYIGDFPTSEEIEYGLIKGLVQSLDDQYTSFLTPEEAEIYFDRRVEDFEGIGVTLAFDGEYTYVETVLEDLPAFQNGVLPGDVILAVDEEDVAGEVPQIVASLIRGEKGTDVTLNIFRQDNEDEFGETLDITITRDTIEVDNIRWNEVERNIAQIDITQFNANTPQELNTNWDTVVADIQEDVPELEGIIVDLRNNPGGYVTGVRYVLEEFLPTDAVLMGESNKLEPTMTFTDDRVGVFEEVPVVVIVNEGSASASEIFASAIQDNERGVVVGMPTVGKGVEQVLIDDFDDGSLLILVFQEWLTPSGRVVTEENPITPDVEVDFTTENFQNGEDPQFDEALKIIKE